MKAFYSIITAILIFSATLTYSQNSASIWKHTCNCGAADMIINDPHNNSYVVTDGAFGLPAVMKISPTGQTKFNNTYLPPGYSQMWFLNSFYHDGYVYLAGYVDSIINVTQRMMLLKIDTLGTVVTQVMVDSVSAAPITGIKSAPFYNYGFYLDQQEHIHLGFIKHDANWSSTSFSFLKLDLNFNLLADY